MDSSLLQSDDDIQRMRDLLKRLPYRPTIADFEESVLLATVRATTRLWRQDDQMLGFAYVDDYNNLCFETDPQIPSDQVEIEIVDWGVLCMKERNARTGKNNPLDSSCSVKNTRRIRILEKYGFVPDSLRTLHYVRSLNEPVAECPLPQGFSLRCVAGEHEVEALVALHRLAFGTENMTVEQRLAIMRSPQYEQELDLLVIAPNGTPSGFCICGLVEGNALVGYTDPIGVHLSYQKLGLGKALLTAGINALKNRGVKVIEFGTSSENIAMQRLAEAVGFLVLTESVWFSKFA